MALNIATCAGLPTDQGFLDAITATAVGVVPFSTAATVHNGFGISNHETFSQAIQYAKGAIIGSAFIKHVSANGVDDLGEFTAPILNG